MSAAPGRYPKAPTPSRGRRRSTPTWHKTLSAPASSPSRTSNASGRRKRPAPGASNGWKARPTSCRMATSCTFCDRKPPFEPLAAWHSRARPQAAGRGQGYPMTERQRFNLHLPGLLKVLAEHLYSSKKVGVRELIQNSHDSCVRRRVEGNDPDYEPRIDLSIDPRKGTLSVSDNGMGLTADEITTYLSTIGRGYTRELRERLSLASAAEAVELIGQFGLGFLSAFLLAGEVTLLTRSAQGGSGYRWHSAGDEYFEMAPAWREEVGTTVELKLKPSARFLLGEEALIDTARQYADFLPIPIHVQGEPLPVNLMAPPWEADQPDRAVKDYIVRAFGSEALWVLPLTDRKV